MEEREEERKRMNDRNKETAVKRTWTLYGTGVKKEEK